MKIAILSRNEELYSTRRLKEAAEEKGHQVKILDYLQCSMNITAENSCMHYQGSEIEHFDAVIPRIGTKRTFYGAAVMRQLEVMGIFLINSSLSLVRARDKLRSLQLLNRGGVKTPETGFANSASGINDLIKKVGGPPLIIKLLEGTQGVGVVLAETKKSAESVVQAFMGLNANIIVQEFIKEADGTDIRCFVLGEKVVAAMQRQAEPGEFRANVHRGGEVTVAKISKVERAMAVKAAKTMGLGMAGVDLIRSSRGPLVLEVNASPGLNGIEKASNKNVANFIIEYLEKHAKRNSRYEG